MNIPTKEQIEQEIAELKAMHLKVRARTIFGDDNREAIRAQIRILEDDLDEDEIWNETWSGHARDAALDARNWLDGEYESRPAEDWKELTE